MWIDRNGSEILNRSDCRRLLALAASKEGIGRLGVSCASAPVIVPVNFTYPATQDHRVVVRLNEGSLSRMVSGALVAFEVDQVDDEEGVAWSVLVRGLAEPLSRHEPETQPSTIPTPLVPSPGNVALAIRDDIVTGRRFSVRVTDRALPIRHSSRAEQPSPLGSSEDVPNEIGLLQEGDFNMDTRGE
jgi:uncharacterized protein